MTKKHGVLQKFEKKFLYLLDYLIFALAVIKYYYDTKTVHAEIMTTFPIN